MVMMPGKVQLRASRITISKLADLLTGQLDRPVSDRTGLTGNYDISLTFAPEFRGRGVVIIPGVQPGGEADAAVTSNPEPVPSLFSAVQDQLGLKLMSARAPIALIVVDRVSKSPVQN